MLSKTSALPELKMGDYPEFVKAIGYVKLAAAQTNHELGLLPDNLLKPISQACEEVISGKFDHQFLVDMIQGGRRYLSEYEC